MGLTVLHSQSLMLSRPFPNKLTIILNSYRKLYHAPVERPKKVKWEIGLVALAVIAAGGVRAICLRFAPKFFLGLGLFGWGPAPS